MDKDNSKTEKAREYFKKCAESNNGKVPFSDFIKYIVEENSEYLTESEKIIERAKLLEESLNQKEHEQC